MNIEKMGDGSPKKEPTQEEVEHRERFEQVEKTHDLIREFRALTYTEKDTEKSLNKFNETMREIKGLKLFQNSPEVTREGLKIWEDSVNKALKENNGDEIEKLFGTGMGDDVPYPDEKEYGDYNELVNDALEEAGYFQCGPCQRWQRGYGKEDPYYVLCQCGCNNKECAHYDGSKE